MSIRFAGWTFAGRRIGRDFRPSCGSTAGTDRRAARDSESVVRQRIRRGGRGLPPRSAREGRRLRGGCRRCGRMGGEKHCFLRRRPAADLHRRTFGGRLPDFDDRAGQTLDGALRHRPRHGVRGADPLQRAGRDPFRATPRNGDSRYAGGRGRHGAAELHTSRLSADPDPLGRPRAGDAGPLRGERLFLAHDAGGGASRRRDPGIRRVRPRQHAPGGPLRRGALHPRLCEKNWKDNCGPDP